MRTSPDRAAGAFCLAASAPPRRTRRPDGGRALTARRTGAVFAMPRPHTGPMVHEIRGTASLAADACALKGVTKGESAPGGQESAPAVWRGPRRQGSEVRPKFARCSPQAPRNAAPTRHRNRLRCFAKSFALRARPG
ncbi:protein of unknown function [Paraburkholderia kururiensis]